MRPAGKGSNLLSEETSMLTRWTITTLMVFAAVRTPSRAQTPVNILQIDLANVVNYVDDLADPSKKATSPAISPLPSNFIWAFKMNFMEGDVVAVNGKPAMGSFQLQYGTRALGSKVLTPGRSIFDLGGGCQLQAAFNLLQQDGTPVGTIMATGTTAMGPPPGAPSSATGFNFVVVGGTGAYLGVRGQTFLATSANIRNASMIEDPAYRRINGGGTARYVVHLIQADWPQVITTEAGPAVFHAPAIFHHDFTPVTALTPANVGEWLTIAAANLGPTRPSVDPGMPFPADKELAVNSPLEVKVGGQAAQIRSAVGWPGQTNIYRVDFRVPDEVKTGPTSVGLTAGWISGPTVTIMVQ